MGTEVTRGRGVLLVTATGMTTQIGGVADLLGTAGRETRHCSAGSEACDLPTR